MEIRCGGFGSSGKMNIYAYIRMRHKLKSAPVRVLLEDYVSGETLVDVRTAWLRSLTMRLSALAGSMKRRTASNV